MFHIHLSLDLVGVLLIDDFFDGSWNQNIAVLIQQILASVRLGTRESNDGAVFNFVIFQFLPLKQLT